MKAEEHTFDSFQELIELLKSKTTESKKDRSSVKPEYKTAGNWFQPIRTETDTNRRAKKAEVESVSALVYDFDGDASLEEIMERLLGKGLNFAIYTSFSHLVKDDSGEEHDRFRVILDVDSEIPAKNFSKIYNQIARSIFRSSTWDSSTADASRIWLCPFSFGDVKAVWSTNFDGDAVKVPCIEVSANLPNASSENRNDINELVTLLLSRGCTSAGNSNGWAHFKRPGTENHLSMSIGKAEDGEDILHVFTSNFPPLEPDRSYSVAEAISLLGGAVQGKSSRKKKGENEEEPKKFLDLCMREIESGGLELWLDQNRNACATYKISENRYDTRIETQHFDVWLTLLKLNESKTTLKSEELKSCKRTLCALAVQDGSVFDMHRRVAHVDDSIFVDLGRDAREVVEINQAGWQVVPCPPNIRFSRTSQQKSLPLPESGGDLEIFKKLFALSDHNNTLLIAWMISTFMRPAGAFPILVVYGEQGSGKSTLSRYVKSALDPTTPLLAMAPKKEEDLPIIVNSLHIAAFDNLSHISNAQSDILATLSTGSGIQARKLYTNDEVASLSVQCPIIINGISSLVRRSDLMQRCIFISLDAMGESRRKGNIETNSEYDEILPKFLGSLYDRLALALANKGGVKVEVSHRLMDCLQFVSESEPPNLAGDFSKALLRNAQIGHLQALEESPIASALLEMTRDEPFCGTVTQLIDAVKQYLRIECDRQLPAYYPFSPPLLGAELNRITPLLREFGVEITRKMTASERTVRIARMEHAKLTSQQLKEFNMIEDMAEREEFREHCYRANRNQ